MADQLASPAPTLPAAPSMPSPPQIRLPEDLRAEYAEVGSYVRHYSNLRFAMLTVYFPVVGALGAVALGIVNGHSRVIDVARVGAAGAALMTAVFFTFEVACERYLRFFGDHLRKLEQELGYSALTLRPRNRGFVRIATNTLYVTSLLFWISVAIFGA